MKQCPQCRRSYDDSQSFCLMDGTPLIDEPELETVVRQTPAPKKKSRLWLWIGLSALLVFIVGSLVAALLIYNFVGRSDNTQAKNNANVKSSPAKTTSSTPKRTPTPEAANNSSVTNASPETEQSPAANTDSEDEVTPIDWMTGGGGFKNDVGMTYKFQCPPNGTERTIWGSDIYTADSSICTAAVHAGLFSLTDGGIVTVEFRPGRLTYGSTTRNGIKSNTFGEFSRSFVVRKPEE
jgi:hypothetical protein